MAKRTKGMDPKTGVEGSLISTVPGTCQASSCDKKSVQAQLQLQVCFHRWSSLTSAIDRLLNSTQGNVETPTVPGTCCASYRNKKSVQAQLQLQVCLHHWSSLTSAIDRLLHPARGDGESHKGPDVGDGESDSDCSSVALGSTATVDLPHYRDKGHNRKRKGSFAGRGSDGDSGSAKPCASLGSSASVEPPVHVPKEGGKRRKVLHSGDRGVCEAETDSDSSWLSCCSRSSRELPLNLREEVPKSPTVPGTGDGCGPKVESENPSLCQSSSASMEPHLVASEEQGERPPPVIAGTGESDSERPSVPGASTASEGPAGAQGSNEDGGEGSGKWRYRWGKRVMRALFNI